MREMFRRARDLGREFIIGEMEQRRKGSGWTGSRLERVSILTHGELSQRGVIIKELYKGLKDGYRKHCFVNLQKLHFHKKKITQ